MRQTGSPTIPLRKYWLIILLLSGILLPSFTPANHVSAKRPLHRLQNPPSPLSPMWDETIQQWADYIGILSQRHGLDPDFIAAVVNKESNGNSDTISRAGAVGLMGVMPTGPGLEWRPSSEELQNPTVNLRWGVAILADVVRQAGGDLYSALAAYSGGWPQANSRVPQTYAANVLDQYARAVMIRNGLSPEIARQWTVAIEMRHGYVPNEPLLILGDQPLSSLQMYAPHVVYDYVDQSGKSYYVTGYVVPVALVVPEQYDPNHVAFGDGDQLDPYLQMRLGDNGLKISESNPHILMACLPSLSRLRGEVSTRWYAPSQCPSWHR